MLSLHPDFLDNPYPAYRILQEHDPIHHFPDGSYFITRYDDLVAVYKNPAFISDKKQEFGLKFLSAKIYINIKPQALSLMILRRTPKPLKELKPILLEPY